MYSSATIKSCVDDEFLKKESDSGYLPSWRLDFFLLRGVATTTCFLTHIRTVVDLPGVRKVHVLRVVHVPVVTGTTYTYPA